MAGDLYRSIMAYPTELVGISTELNCILISLPNLKCKRKYLLNRRISSVGSRQLDQDGQIRRVE